MPLVARNEREFGKQLLSYFAQYGTLEIEMFLGKIFLSIDSIQKLKSLLHFFALVGD